MARRRRLTKTQKSFYGGVITALGLLAGHDAETIYDELVETVDLAELIYAAAQNNDLEYSGLLDYDYARRIKCPGCGFRIAYADDSVWRCARCDLVVQRT